MPKYSIISATYNCSEVVNRLIDSVNNQVFKDFEHIIIDGYSTDSTVRLLEDNSSHNNTHIISESDSGIYDAWNKGIRLASGDYILFWAADDYYDSDYLKNIDVLVTESVLFDEFLIYGNVVMKNNSTCNYENSKFNECNLYRGFGFRTVTCVFSAKLFKNYGCFDSRFKIAGDSDFLLRLYKANVPMIKGEYSCIMSADGLSNKYEFRAYYEYFKALLKNELFFFRSLVVMLKKFIKDFL